jgi:adenylate cyclase
MIFLSYSRKDSSEALALASRLREHGIEVWIDQEGINVATIWSTEIANAIRDAQVFVILLSELSLGSGNVRKEIALASQYGRPILPLDLRPVRIPDELADYFEGLDHIHHARIEQILAALQTYGINEGSPLRSLSGPGSFSHGRSDKRKSLMVLPFLDHSPSRDNEWFADGIATELIVGLSKLKQMRVIDWSTTKEYKKRQIPIVQLANELDVRYFVEGSVRTFGDQVKITVQLLDADEESYIWTTTFKGELSDIFEIQEGVASKVVEGLQLHLSDDEISSVGDRGTTNVEAYQLWLRSQELYSKHTKESSIEAMKLSRAATELDPHFVRAHLATASGLVEYYRIYDRDLKHLEDAERECAVVEQYAPYEGLRLGVLGRIALQRNDLSKALAFVEAYVKLSPELYDSHYTMALVCQLGGEYQRAIEHYEKSLEIDPNRLIGYWNLVVACETIGDTERQTKWAKAAVPQFERRVRLNPDDENSWVWLVNLLYLSGEASAAVDQLKTLPELNEVGALYNLACFADRVKEHALVVPLLKRCVASGFNNIEMLEDGWLDFQGDAEFKQLLTELREKIEAKKAAKVG